MKVDGKLNNLKKEVAIQDSKHRKTLSEVSLSVQFGTYSSIFLLNSKVRKQHI